MNIAVIFAGGSGHRMCTKDKPKQFLMIHGKPIIVHTIENFERHPQINGIIVVCIEKYIPYMEELIYRYRLEKIKSIVPGGKTGQLSIYNGLTAAEKLYKESGTIVLIHDGVRPLITEEEISANIASVKENGSAVTCSRTKETFVVIDKKGNVSEVPDRSSSFVAKAPQSFYLSDILAIQRKAISEGKTDIIDSCTLMRNYGYTLSVVEGSYENIKITTPEDFYMFRALYDARENRQLNEI